MLVCKGLVSFDADGYGGVLDIEVLDGLLRGGRSSLSSLRGGRCSFRRESSCGRGRLYIRRIVGIVDGDAVRRRASGEKGRR